MMKSNLKIMYSKKLKNSSFKKNSTTASVVDVCSSANVICLSEQVAELYLSLLPQYEVTQTLLDAMK